MFVTNIFFEDQSWSIFMQRTISKHRKLDQQTQTDGQTDRQTDRLTETDRQTVRNRQKDRQKDTLTDRHRKTNRRTARKTANQRNIGEADGGGKLIKLFSSGFMWRRIFAGGRCR